MFIAPTAPPGSFHISVLNSTALEATWALPPVRKLNGRVRGFKIFIKKAGASESVIKVGPDVRAYIIGGLAPETAYTISMLVYTVADGPRSVHLTVLTPATGMLNFLEMDRYQHGTVLYLFICHFFSSQSIMILIIIARIQPPSQVSS